MVKKKSSCGCFGFFSFFSSKKRLQVISIPNSQSSQPVENNSPINSHQSDEKSKKNPKIEVITKLTSEDVKVLDFINHTYDRMDFPYSCTICLRNFNKLVQTSCCKNYICLFCVEDCNKRYDTTPNLKIRCHYCNEEEFQFIDVNPTEKIKRYSDSLSSFYSNINFKKTLKPIIPSTLSKKEEFLNSPPANTLFNAEHVNFYNTTEKPLQNIAQNKETNVFFFSDGFKRAPILQQLNDNLYIYNEDQSNYQPLSKFSKKNDQKSIKPNGYLVEKNYFQGYTNAKLDPRNISESAEFRQDESFNDRDIDRNNDYDENDRKINEEIEENHKEDDPIEEEQKQLYENEEIYQRGVFFNSFHPTTGAEKNKFNGIRNFGETV